MLGHLGVAKGKSPLALRLENFTQSIQNGFRSTLENERCEIECGNRYQYIRYFIKLFAMKAMITIGC